MAILYFGLVIAVNSIGLDFAFLQNISLGFYIGTAILVLAFGLLALLVIVLFIRRLRDTNDKELKVVSSCFLRQTF